MHILATDSLRRFVLLSLQNPSGFLACLCFDNLKSRLSQDMQSAYRLQKPISACRLL